jgi:hypothetical protein
MAFSFLYLAFRALGALVRSRRGLDVKDIELLVLRHELEVLRRQVGRPKLGMPDRALLVAAAVHLPRPSRAVLLVTPRTLLRWHQALVRRRWRQRPGRVGRPPLPPEVRELVLRLRAREPSLGSSPDLRRAAQARLHRLADEHPAASHSRRSGAGTASRRPQLARVPEVAGDQHHRVRLLHGRNRLPPRLLRALLHRAREPSCLVCRLPEEPDRGVGDPAGAQPRPRLLRPGRAVPYPRPR